MIFEFIISFHLIQVLCIYNKLSDFFPFQEKSVGLRAGPGVEDHSLFGVYTTVDIGNSAQIIWK